MFLDKTTLRVVTSVSLLLVLAFAVTGFINAAYRREKLLLGERHYQAGRRLETNADVPGAVEEYRMALLYSPDKPEYRMSFAQALVDAGRLDEAELHIEQLLQEDPTNGVLNLMLGRIAAKRRQLGKAVDYYERAVYEYWPPSRAVDRRQARWELISLLDRAGRREQVIGELMTMYANAPADVNLRMRIGFDLLNRNAPSEALEVFRDLVRLAPRNADVYRGWGQALLANGDYVSARHNFERALKLNPKDHLSAESLALDNSIIELDPEMPSLTSAERYRRSQNLLRRVLAEVQKCDSPPDADVLSGPENLLSQTSGRDPDLALQLQKAAEQLWNSQQKTCGSRLRQSAPLVAVLERITNE